MPFMPFAPKRCNPPRCSVLLFARSRHILRLCVQCRVCSPDSTNTASRGRCSTLLPVPRSPSAAVAAHLHGHRYTNTRLSARGGRRTHGKGGGRSNATGQIWRPFARPRHHKGRPPARERLDGPWKASSAAAPHQRPFEQRSEKVGPPITAAVAAGAAEPTGAYLPSLPPGFRDDQKCGRSRVKGFARGTPERRQRCVVKTRRAAAWPISFRWTQRAHAAAASSCTAGMQPRVRCGGPSASAESARQSSFGNGAFARGPVAMTSPSSDRCAQMQAPSEECD